MHAKKVGTASWLGKVTGDVPEQKLRELEKAFEKEKKKASGRSGLAAEGGREALGGACEEAGASAGSVYAVERSEEEQGLAEAMATGGGGLKRLRRAGFAVGSVSEGLGREPGGGRGELHADAAERRREVETERGVGDQQKVARMEQQSRKREQMREALFGKR